MSRISNPWNDSSSPPSLYLRRVMCIKQYRSHQSSFWTGRRPLYQFAHGIGRTDRIVVQQPKEFCASIKRRPQPHIAATRESNVLPRFNQLRLRKGGSYSLHGIVRRPVVHHNDLQIAIVLFPQRRQTIQRVQPPIPVHDDTANARTGTAFVPHSQTASPLTFLHNYTGRFRRLQAPSLGSNQLPSQAGRVSSVQST